MGSQKYTHCGLYVCFPLKIMVFFSHGGLCACCMAQREHIHFIVTNDFYLFS